MALTFDRLDEILKRNYSNESYWAVLCCGTVCYAVQDGSNFFESVDEILKCNHSNESYWAVLCCGAVYFTLPGSPNFWVCEGNAKVIQIEATAQYFRVVQFTIQHKLFMTFESVAEINPKACPFKWTFLNGNWTDTVFCLISSENGLWQLLVSILEALGS